MMTISEIEQYLDALKNGEDIYDICQCCLMAPEYLAEYLLAEYKDILSVEQQQQLHKFLDSK